MIITRSPLRITLGGGGTDLPSYYQSFGGFVIAAAIDRYVYVTISRPFAPSIHLKYSDIEHVAAVDEIRHPIIREALRMQNLRTPQIEITTLADIPAGTGLGSSGSFTTALLKALHVHQRHMVPPAELAEQACHIEIERLGERIGKQDQYVAAFGGLTCLRFHRDGQVEVTPLRVSQETLETLEDNLLLFFTGYTRKASAILADQDERTAHDAALVENLHRVKALGEESRQALEEGDLRRFATLLSAQWERKKERAGAASNAEIDAAYALACASGALGGKLIGAGGGGFLLFYTEDKARLRAALAPTALREVRFRFDFQGTRVVIE